MVTLSHKFDISIRSVYRYIKNINDAGYNLNRDEKGMFKLNTTDLLQENLTYDEITRLCELASKAIYTSDDRMLYNKLLYIRRSLEKDKE
jgi:transcriptional antiterminator